MGTCDKSLTMLAAALENEEKGKSFYQQAASTCKNERCKEIFNVLMADENVHMTRIQKIHSALTGSASWSSDWKACTLENENLPNLLCERAKSAPKVGPDTTDLEAVNIGIDMEKYSINFYSEQQSKATDAMEKEFAGQMVSEERAHLKTLEDLKLFLTDPESWYIEKEHHGLDGA